MSRGWLLLPAAAAGAAAAGTVVPAGPFTMGAADGDPDERPPRRVAVARFAIDRTEVTNAAYAECVAAGACKPREAYPGTDESEQPAVGVSWFDARDFCKWAGRRLPTEAEWEKAARGTDGRRYPWGNDLHCARANFGNFKGSGPCPDNPGRPEKVGARPGGASPSGALDMVGNVWEWTAERVLRGHGCCGTFTVPRATDRLRLPPEYRDNDIGFRCAK